MVDFQRLDATHDLEAFECGDASMDRWFRAHALSNQEAYDSATYVGVDDGGNVVCFFTVAPTMVKESDAPSWLMMGWPSRGIPIPGWLLGRMAVHAHHQAQGLGRRTVREALRTVASATKLTGGRVVVVDAMNDGLVDFYTKMGFDAFPGDPLRLGIAMMDVMAVVY